MLPQSKNHVIFSNCFVPVNNILQHCHVSIRQGVIEEVIIASEANFRSIHEVDQKAFGECFHVDDDTIQFECAGKILAPGFIDIQLNGAFGVDFSNPSVTCQDVLGVASKLTRYGVTSFCPTMVSSTRDTYEKVLPTIGKLCIDDQSRTNRTIGRANLCGIHLEGPFFSFSKRGAHAAECIRETMDKQSSFNEVYNCSVECLNDAGIAIVTLAPELPGALDCVQALSENGIRVAIGHTDAVLADGLEAKKRGASLITHLYNAMRPFHHREPALLGMLQDECSDTQANSISGQIHYSIIVDGLHSNPVAVKMAYMLSKSVVLVTDAMGAMGLEDGRHKLGSMEVDVKDKKATISGTDTLAGSVASMDSCIQNFKQFTGCTYVEALAAATTKPAKILGIHDYKGVVRAGMDADLVILDEDLKVLRTIVSGYMVYSQDESCSAYIKHTNLIKAVLKKRKLHETV